MAKKTKKTSRSTVRKSTPKNQKKANKAQSGFNLSLHIKTNLNFYLSMLVTAVLSLGVWLYFDDRVTRFSFLMPLIATWIFYLIMTEVEDDKESVDK